jgi:hypothetical protein
MNPTKMKSSAFLGALHEMNSSWQTQEMVDNVHFHKTLLLNQKIKFEIYTSLYTVSVVYFDRHDAFHAFT